VGSRTDGPHDGPYRFRDLHGHAYYSYGPWEMLCGAHQECSDLSATTHLVH